MPSQRKAGAVLGYANIIVKNVVYLLYTPMLLSFVGQADYGVFQTANNFIVSLQLLTFGFSGAYVRFYMLRKAEDDEDGIRRLNGMYLVLYLIICAVAIALGLTFSTACNALFAGSFSVDEIGLASAIMAILTFNVATTLLSTVFDSFIVAHERFAFQQTRQMATTLAVPVFALVMLSLGWGVIGVTIVQLAVNLVLLGLNARYAIGKLGMRFDVRHAELSAFKAIAVFSGWIFLNQLFDLITMNLPSVILAALAGAAPVAVFAIAASLRSVFYSLSTTISSLFVPLVNKMVAERDDNAELTHLMVRVGRYQAIVYCWVLGGFVVLGRWFVNAWAGPSYSEAYWMTLAMVIPTTVPLIQNAGIEIQKAKNKHKPRSIAYMICAAIDLVITYVLASSLGAWGAVIGFDFFIIFASWLFMNWYYQHGVGLDMPFFWRRTAPIILAVALAASICLLGTRLFPVDGIVEFLAWGILYTVACIAILWPLVLDKCEKDQLRRLLSRIVRQAK